MITYRVYIRWPGSRVSDKTVTHSYEIAMVALNDLINRHKGEKCAATMTQRCADGKVKNLGYYELDKITDSKTD